MYNRNDPRFRRTLDHISSNLESANETAQVGLFSLAEHCLKPCFISLSNCVQQTGDACITCFPRSDERQRHLRRTRTGRAGGRLERSFDFYDDWEQDENEALLTWGNDEFDRLLGEENQSGSTGEGMEPSRRGVMNYGSAGAGTRVLGRRKRGAALSYDGREDPTIIPNQSYFGFLDRMPFKIGGRGLKYKPSAADLKERPRDKATDSSEDQLDHLNAQRQHGSKKYNRRRSNTSNSGDTEDSYSSRGDIFPSDEEDDAVPLDDSFAITLDRRTEDSNSSRTKKSRRMKDKLSRESSSKSSRPSSKHSKSSSEMEESIRSGDISAGKASKAGPPTLEDLKDEEAHAQEESEEQDIDRRREAAQRLAMERGLDNTSKLPDVEVTKTESTQVDSTPSSRSVD